MKFAKAKYLSAVNTAKREYHRECPPLRYRYRWLFRRRAIAWPLRYLMPICRVHHITRGYGYVITPVLPWTVGYFPSGGRVVYGPPSVACNDWISERFIGLMRRSDMHNCTWSGVY